MCDVDKTQDKKRRTDRMSVKVLLEARSSRHRVSFPTPTIEAGAPPAFKLRASPRYGASPCAALTISIPSCNIYYRSEMLKLLLGGSWSMFIGSMGRIGSQSSR